jgi:membrane fusion protein (multidrug efflux system)
MVECLATVTDADPLLKPGFFADVTVEAKAAAPSVVAPEDAVLPTEQGTVVFVVEDGKARLVPVTVGMRTRSGLVEVVAGLAEGDVLAVKGAGVLADGQAVEVVPPAPPSTPADPAKPR